MKDNNTTALLLKLFIQIVIALLCVHTVVAQSNVEFYKLYQEVKQPNGSIEEVKENNEPITIVECLYETKDGVIWIGTKNGLIAYYGTYFKHYSFEANTKESLPSNNVFDIWEEAPGMLWISTSNGLAKLDRIRDKMIRFPVASRFVCKGSDGILYTTAKDLYVIDTSNKKLVHVPGQEIYLENGEPYKDEYMKSIYHFNFDRDQTLWATGASKSLKGLFNFNFKTHHWTFHAQPAYYDATKRNRISLNSFPEERTDSNSLTNEIMYIFNDDRIWLCGEEGLTCYNTKKSNWKQFNFLDTNLHTDNLINGIVPLNNDTLLLSGFQHTFLFNTDESAYKQNIIDTITSFDYHEVLLKDHQGNMWYSDYKALYKLNRISSYFQEVNKLPMQVAAFLPLHSNDFLVKQGSRIVRIINNRIVDSVVLPKTISGFSKIIAAGNDKFYLISNHICEIDWKTKVVQVISLKEINSTLSEPISIISSVLWNDSTLYCVRAVFNHPDFIKINLNRNTAQYFTTPAKALSSSNILHNSYSFLFLDSYKRIWITSYNAGIDIFYPETETFEHYDHISGDSTSLDNNLAPVVAETRNHRFFVATLNGLLEVKAKPGTPFTFKLVVPVACNSHVIVEDTTGMLWIKLTAGMLRFNPATTEYKVYTASDFWWADLNQFYKTPDGNFLMPDGTIINPYHVHYNTLEPTPRIVDFMIAGQPTHFDTAIEFKKHIQLLHDQNFFNIIYSCNNYVNEEKNEYRYFLQGVDKSWTNAGTRTVAFYTALPPGDYHFYVQAANNDGLWGDEKLMLTISIIPAWYQTGLFKMLLAVAIIAIVYIIYRQRINAIRAKSLAEQREAELKQVKAEFEKQIAETEMAALRAQMNPHFIFNVLNSINRFILSNDSGVASDYLSQFSRLIRLILENSKSAKVPLEKDLEALHIYIDMEKLRFRSKFSYEIIVDENIDSNYVQVPPLLIQPYVENAIWHGLMQKEATGHLCVSLVLLKEDLMKVTIEDNGIGREKSAQLKSKTAVTHKSFGLQISKDRMSIVNKLYGINTQVEVEDLKDEHNVAAGTRINLFIPV